MVPFDFNLIPPNPCWVVGLSTTLMPTSCYRLVLNPRNLPIPILSITVYLITWRCSFWRISACRSRWLLKTQFRQDYGGGSNHCYDEWVKRGGKALINTSSRDIWRSCSRIRECYEGLSEYRLDIKPPPARLDGLFARDPVGGRPIYGYILLLMLTRHLPYISILFGADFASWKFDTRETVTSPPPNYHEVPKTFQNI